MPALLTPTDRRDLDAPGDLAVVELMLADPLLTVEEAKAEVRLVAARCYVCGDWHTTGGPVSWSKHPHGIELPSAICPACDTNENHR